MGYNLRDLSLTSALASAEKRRELLYALLHAGFQVRMHSYEYFIRRGKFVSIVILSPTWNTAKIKLIGWNLKDSAESAKEIEIILKGLDPGIGIDTS